MFHNKKEKDSNGNNVHDSQKPVKLFQTMIENSSKEGEIVLDPFIGSGTAAIACIRANRHFIGFELDKKYFDISMQRIKQEQSQLKLF